VKRDFKNNIKKPRHRSWIYNNCTSSWLNRQHWLQATSSWCKVIDCSILVIVFSTLSVACFTEQAFSAVRAGCDIDVQKLIIY
jgi:hypothetical protein